MALGKHIREQRLVAVFAVGALVLGGMGLTTVSVMPRMLRRNRDLLSLRMTRRLNELRGKRAGTLGSPLALLTHVGRRSGRSYRTALGAGGYGDGFLLPLAYGTQTDWYRNVVAAGTCLLDWNGSTYQLERPEVISGRHAMRAWPLGQRTMLRLAGIHDFLWLHETAAASR